MEFQFAKATDITEHAKKHFEWTYDHTCVKVFICPDVHDFHILRVIKGYGDDYELCEGSFILEHQKIPKDYKGQSIESINHLNDILEEDDGSNYDYSVQSSLQDCIEIVDGGYGILNRTDYA